MNLSRPLSRALSNSLRGQLGGLGAANVSRGIVLTVTDNGDGTATLNWTDSVTRVEGYYRIYVNGFNENTEDYDVSTSGVIVNDPFTEQEFYVVYHLGDDTLVATSNVVNITITGDTLGESRAQLAEAAGFTFGGSKPRQTFVDLFSNLRSLGELTNVPECHANIFSAATPNALLLISGASGTFPSGTATHNTTNVAYSSNGYFNYGKTPAAMGQTANNNGLLVAYNTTRVAGANKEDIGVTNAAGSDFELLLAWAGPLLFSSRGNTSTAAINNVNSTTALQPGITIGWRNGVNGGVDYWSFATQTKTILATSSSLSGGGMPNLNLTEGAQNQNGVITRHTNAAYLVTAPVTPTSSLSAGNIALCFDTFFRSWSLV